LAISVAGGDLQDQATTNLLLDFVEFGMLPEDAVTAPRFATAHHEDSFDPNPNRAQTFGQAGSLTINDSVSENVREELGNRGHQLRTHTGAIAAPVMLYMNKDNGTFYAAGDPAAGRHAAGLA
jgi:gamma-glutamyltranspeptidase/glutathione hydrolase